MSIGGHKAGAVVDCTTCGRPVVVPLQSESLRRRSSGAAPEARRERRRSSPPRPAQGPETPVAATLRARPPRGDPGATAADEMPRLPLRRRDEEQEDLDLTPMVDVTFLLLIFFMLTASYTLQKTFEMPRQQREQQAARQAPTLEELENRNVVVRIDADNTILVDDEKTTPEQLVARIRRARSTGRPGLLIAADDRSLHETTVRVIDAASAVGMDQVQLALPTGSR